MIRYLSLPRIILLCSAILLVSLASAQTPKELYDYEYIVALYEQQSDTTALIEIDKYLNSYTNGYYLSQVLFMKAEILYFSGSFSDAASLYDTLADSDIDVLMLQDVLLHNGISNYYLKHYDRARKTLEKLLLSGADDDYRAQANLWLAKTSYASGQYYSAEKYYSFSIENYPDDQSIKFEHYNCLLKLDREDEALTIYESLKANEVYRDLYLEALLAYFINSAQYSRFAEYSKAMLSSPDLASTSQKQLLAQYYYATEQTENFARLVDAIPTTLRQFDYYRALLFVQRNEYDKADSLYAILTKDSVPEIAVLSYLERIKLLARYNPESAIEQLDKYINSSQSVLLRGEQYQLIGYLYHITGKYDQAIKHLLNAAMYELSGDNLDRVYSLIPASLYKSGRSEEAIEYYNRYLNLFPNGRFRADVLDDLGHISSQSKDYDSAIGYFTEIITSYPEYRSIGKVRFHLGETYFLTSRYRDAISAYSPATADTTLKAQACLRLAQSYYFLKDYPAADSLLSGLNQPEMAIDVLMLKGSIAFNQRNYTLALRHYESAIAEVDSNLVRNELLSYKALTLYQLKRFSESSAIFYQLSTLKESPDTYLYLSAKSAYLGGNYPKALELYYSFVEQYPDSDFILEVCSEIATINYNQTNYSDSLNDWINILKRFTAKSGFDSKELQLLRNVFSGMELCLLQIEDDDVIGSIAELSETFLSDYIKFELQYLIVKLYASRDLWADLLTEAEKIRSEYPVEFSSDIELLMAESLIRLNRYTEADSLISSVYDKAPSKEILLKWAEYDMLVGKYESARDKYERLYRESPESSLWAKLLECSAQLGYLGFSDLWSKDLDAQTKIPNAAVLNLNYRLFVGDYNRVISLSDSLLSIEYSPLIHGKIYLAQAKALFLSQSFSEAVSKLQRIRLVFKDYPELIAETNYWLVKSLYSSGLVSEAEAFFTEVKSQLTSEMISEIEETLER